MKAYLFCMALIGGILATNACLAAERAHTPAGAVAPTDHAGGHETTGPGGSKSSVQTAPGAASEHFGIEGHDNGVSQALKPNAGTPGPTHAHGPRGAGGHNNGVSQVPKPNAGTSGPTHAHGARQSIDRNSNNNARSPSPIDTHITVNQGRTPVNSNKGLVHKDVGPLGKGGIHVPHSISRPAVVPGPTRNASPTRNAIGVARDPNAAARRMSTTPFRGPAAVTRSGTYSSGIRPPSGAPVVGGAGLGTGTGAVRMGRPIGTSGSASISGTGMARGGLRVGQIGGPVKSNGGVSGTSVRAKRP